MTKVFRFTDGATANSVSGTGPFPAGTPFNTGTSRTRPTTRQGIFDEIALALVAAGWTEVQHVASTRHVYKSDGEDTTENVNIELNFTGTGRYLHFNIGTKVNVSDELEGKIGNDVDPPGATQDNNGLWDLTAADFTSDFFILATKDHLFACFQDINHTSPIFWVSIGLGKRTNILNPNKYAIVNNPVAGSYVSLDVTPGNPLSDGYRPGETIDMVEVAAAEVARARRLLITGVTSSAFEVLSLPVDFHAGALVGAQPSPLVRAVGTNEVPDDTTLWSTPLAGTAEYAGSTPTSFAATADQGELLASVLGIDDGNGAPLDEIYFSSNAGYTSSGEFGAGGTPNQRTQRFTCRNIALAEAQQEIALVHPNLITFPGTAGLYPHDWFFADRLTPQLYYVAFRPTASTTERWGVGPTI